MFEALTAARNFLKGYRTVIINLLMALVPILDYLAASGNLIASVYQDPKQAALVMIGVNAVNILLRMDTNTAIGQKTKVSE